MESESKILAMGLDTMMCFKRKKEFKMNSNLKDVVNVVFEPAVKASEVSQSTVAIASGLVKILAARFIKGLDVRNKLKASFDESDDSVKSQSIAKRILAKDIELEVLRNFHSLCTQAEVDLTAKLPAAARVDMESIGDIAGLDETNPTSQDS
jgi:hypothetical protein